MFTFLIALAILILGYVFYGAFIEKVFKPDDRITPAVSVNDGVDYVPMKQKWNVFLIQLLNIAGLGPIYGAILGALFGPAVYIWIVFGCIFAGAVHDYLSGMISMRHNGANISELVGIYLGNGMKWVMRIFSVILLVLVGTVFMSGPAALLAKLTPGSLNLTFWLYAILIYYFLATVLPFDKIIGRLYPVFGFVLIFMAVGVGGMLLINNGTNPLPELTSIPLANVKGQALWPIMFITVACGAISGFHATQSPMVARVMMSEKDGRKIFYGAMIAEGVIALVWAAAGTTFYQGPVGLNAALASLGGQGGVVFDVSKSLLGPVGGVLAILGVVAAPITSGDTAFRAARLTLADIFKMEQKPLKNRLIIAVPLLFVGWYLTQGVDYQIIWRYFSWANQTLAMIALWMGAAYLYQHKLSHWIASIPATFMSAVSVTYILQAAEGFKLATSISYPVGFVSALCLFGLFYVLILKKARIAV
ncbi:MAG: putative carbon starvation protein CstA [Erysipelotrichaceae bacterium]|nr:MAG: putative carbon starvation protein [Erysipelotrichaceae bacterium]TXT18601.1 MAG: putative carbon starvation protein CstA [Erysipelotrichaceae bacterium]